MAESRRVQLSLVPSPAPTHPPAPKKPRNDDQDTESPVAATVRIALSLFEPDHKKCPEFCYPELLRNLQGKVKKTTSAEKPQKKPLNLFNYEEAERKEVENLAQKFEEKYGNKKRRRDRLQDLIDMGYGYDESDSFIDNSEAYDELVPASLTTKYGGFYINSGTLQFRQASESEDESVKEKKKKSPKKMKERGDKVKKKKREDNKKGKKSKHPKPGFTALNGTKDKKVRKYTLNLTEMLALFKREKEAKKPSSSTPVTPTLKGSSTTTPTLPTLPLPFPQEAEQVPEPLLPLLVSETELLQAANAMELLSQKDLDNLLDTPPEKGEVGAIGETHIQEFKKPPSVPDGLSPPLEKQIKELTKAVRMSEGDKKTILFTQEMNTALLEIYLLSRDLTSELRAAVFTHLSSVLPCSKDTLVKWATRLYLHKQGGRLREPLRKLKEAVAKAMPEQVNKYHEEYKIHTEAKYAKMLAEDKEKEQKTLSEEDEEEDKGNKRAAGPRKKFQWNDEIRQLLCQLVRMKVEMCEPEGSSMLSLEDYFKSFLDVEVRPLWPRGWMQARMLYRESTRLYPQLSTIMTKNKATTPPKVKVKETSNKPDKNISPAPMETPGAATTTPVPAKDSPVPPSIVSSGGSPLSACTQDNSLDGDLILNPPSLDAVSEHLTALSGRTSAIVFDFPTPKLSGVEKSVVVEEKKKPYPPVSVATSSQLSPRPIFAEKPLTLGPERKLPAPIFSPKPMPEVKPKPPLLPPPPQHQHVLIKTSQMTSPSLQPSVKLYHISNQHSKGSFPHPIQSGGPRVPTPSLPQRPVTSQIKSCKPQGFPPPSLSAGNNHKPIVSPTFVGKHPSNASTVVAQVYRPPVPRLPMSPRSNSVNTTATLNPSPPALARNPTMVLPKKPPHPPQKLTLMAPQNSGGGTQGVAKLLTSSMVAGVGGNNATPTNLNQSQKGGAGPGVLSSAPSLTVLTPSYKPNGGKLTTPTSLSLLPPIHTFPLHVISFTTDPTPKPGASKDAIVTGPAPGTFNHGLARNLLGGPHANSGHHSSPIPRPALSGHLQPAQTDGAHVHSKGTIPPQRKL